MSKPTIEILLKICWGASASPFAETCPTPFETPSFLDTLGQLEQLLRLRASGIFRWREVGVQTCPFDAQALTLLHQTAAGVGRTINQIGTLATTFAAQAKSTAITHVHVQEAITQLPWLGTDARHA